MGPFRRKGRPDQERLGRTNPLIGESASGPQGKTSRVASARLSCGETMSLATKPALSASGTDPAWRTCKRRQTRSTKQDRMTHLWLLIQFFERWLVPCCWALPPLATNPCIVASWRTQLFAFAPRSILWYSRHHSLRRGQTADRSIEVRANSA